MHSHHRPLGDNSAPKILLIQFKYLGDVVVLTPVFRVIRERYPGSVIDIVIPSNALPLVQGNPFVRHVHGLSQPHGRIEPGDFFSLVRALRRERYDVSVDFWGNDRGALLSRLVGAPVRIGAQPRRGFWFRRRLYTHVVEEFDVERHEVVRDWSVLEPLDVPAPSDFSVHVPKPQGFDDAARNLLGDVEVLCNVSASQARREWPLANWIEFHDRALPLGKVIAFTSGHAPQERSKLDEVRRVRPDIRVIDPPEPLPLYLAVLDRLAMFVTCDSGPMHFAAGLDTPTLSMFGPTRAGRWAPIGDIHTHLQAGLCLCSGHATSCTSGRHCIEEIDVDRLVEAYSRKFQSG